MSLLTTLTDRAGALRGEGVNHEGEAFVGQLQVVAVMGGRAVTLHYSATGLDGRLLHEEFALLAVADDQRLCLWPVMTELPFVMPHSAIGAGDAPPGETREVFATGARDAVQGFREEITIECGADGAIVYAHAWGMPGGEFAARSRCELFPQKK
ncbi:MAG: hypothetical protein H7Y61_19340 [Rhizobiales bacterium]|nr:hypothetical protein [Rhizobacter sp.]